MESTVALRIYCFNSALHDVLKQAVMIINLFNEKTNGFRDLDTGGIVSMVQCVARVDGDGKHGVCAG